MSFLMTEEQKMATEGLRKFLNKEIKPQLEAHGEGHFSKEQLQGGTKV
ncbi:hypothetical protein L3081_25940 [Colwellia sp. MSW7]|uniref:Acyl-CoA dehydrogenase n=1 Tax=Colwellia maritima TaxID=2912588 RepID=A0ABS9X9W9_9GAMM|nr:hypothetical protein [Colwellia maritima]MCI2286241.1 hypothetical protein [Colwellia maritima]